MSAHDRWLADYSTDTITVYCANRKCGYHDGIVVTLEREYGQSWITPEDCPSCHSELLDDQPEDEDEPDEDAPETPQEPISAPSNPRPYPLTYRERKNA